VIVREINRYGSDGIILSRISSGSRRQCHDGRARLLLCDGKPVLSSMLYGLYTWGVYSFEKG
jgi:hypothetical protein